MGSRKSQTELMPRSVDLILSVFSTQVRLLLLHQRDESVMVPETSLPTCSRGPGHVDVGNPFEAGYLPTA